MSAPTVNIPVIPCPTTGDAVEEDVVGDWQKPWRSFAMKFPKALGSSGVWGLVFPIKVLIRSITRSSGFSAIKLGFLLRTALDSTNFRREITR